MDNKKINDDASLNIDKESFIDFLSKSSPEDINDYIRKNGKDNSKSYGLFRPAWEVLFSRADNNKSFTHLKGGNQDGKC